MTFTVGVNLPWVDGQYDHDFGYNMTRKQDVDYEPNPTFSKENFERYIKDISEIGIRVVRLWLFERFEGLIIEQGNIVGPDEKFIYNLIDACAIAKKYDVKFYFCLMDSWGITADELSNDVKKKYLKLAKEVIINQKYEFIDAVYQVFYIPEIKNQTWAIDVLNEPEGLEQNKHDDRRKETGINWNNLIKYIKFALTTLKQKTGLAVSCGFQESSGMLKAKNKIQGLVDFFDFHRYNDSGNLPRYDSLGISKPCIIGECGQETKEWDDSLQVTVVKKFLENSKNLGYSGCFFWEYGYKDLDKTDKEKSWSMINPDETHRPAVEEIKNFCKNKHIHQNQINKKQSFQIL